MVCPECGAEIGESDTCGKCGGAAPGAPPDSALPEPPARTPGAPELTTPAPHAGMIEIDYSAGGADNPSDDSVPEWKKELSRRLQEIRARRQMVAGPTPELPDAQGTLAPEAAPLVPETPLPALPPPDSEPAKPATPPRPSRREYSGPSRRSPSRTQKPVVVQKPEPPGEGLPLFPKVEAEPPPQPPPPSDVGSIIDQVIASHIAAGAGPTTAGQVQRAAEEPAPAAAGKAATDRPRIVVACEEGPGEGELGENRMILLSRTLAGLVDLIVVLGCTTGIIICADLVAQIEVMDGTSMITYGGLLLALFFIYSVYFLGTGGQTMGMMITDLHVVGEGDSRPSLRSLLGRTAAFLLSIALGGLGLLWGFFDKRSRCLHDRLSGTHVVRP